jgi:thiamine kinase-like enzyme
VIKEFETLFLFDGYQTYFSSLLNRVTSSHIVLAHNDIQECNILASLANPSKDFFIIDYEYAEWQPRAMDIANYFNETVFDNSYSFGSGVGSFMDNMITASE